MFLFVIGNRDEPFLNLSVCLRYSNNMARVRHDKYYGGTLCVRCAWVSPPVISITTHC